MCTHHSKHVYSQCACNILVCDVWVILKQNIIISTTFVLRVKKSPLNDCNLWLFMIILHYVYFCFS